MSLATDVNRVCKKERDGDLRTAHLGLPAKCQAVEAFAVAGVDDDDAV